MWRTFLFSSLARASDLCRARRSCLVEALSIPTALCNARRCENERKFQGLSPNPAKAARSVRPFVCAAVVCRGPGACTGSEVPTSTFSQGVRIPLRGLWHQGQGQGQDLGRACFRSGAPAGPITSTMSLPPPWRSYATCVRVGVAEQRFRCE